MHGRCLPHTARDSCCGDGREAGGSHVTERSHGRSSCIDPCTPPAARPAPALTWVQLTHTSPQEVGGSTKAAQAAAAIAQQRRPAGPHRLVTWRHIHTGASLVVEVPLSVFRKQRGAVFRKWQQRAWRALYALRCEAGEEVWPKGCREAAAAGAPCWDDLEEETAALAKLPFCMPQKVRRGRGDLAQPANVPKHAHLRRGFTCLWTGALLPVWLLPVCLLSVWSRNPAMPSALRVTRPQGPVEACPWGSAGLSPRRRACPASPPRSARCSCLGWEPSSGSSLRYSGESAPTTVQSDAASLHRCAS